MSFSVQQLIQSAGELPPMPQTTQKALAIIRSPESTALKLAKVLSMDQVLTGLLLRWANSAYYGVQSKVATVQQAVVVVGMNTVREILLASSVAGFLNRPLPGYDLMRGELWRHAIGVATGARMIAEKCGFEFAEEAYHAGLLCDIGKLAFEKLLRNTDVALSSWKGSSFLEMERVHFGIDHAMLGAEMARRWRLPDDLVTAIAFHHNPIDAKEHVLISSVVHVADAAMMMLGVGVGKDGLRYPLNPEALARLKMNDKDLITLFDQIIAQIQLAEVFIGFDWGNNY